MTRNSLLAQTVPFHQRIALRAQLVGLLLLGSLAGCDLSSSADSSLDGQQAGSGQQTGFIRRQVEVPTAQGLQLREVEYRSGQLLVLLPEGAVSMGGNKSREPQEVLFRSQELRTEILDQLKAKKVRRLGGSGGRALENLFLLEGIELDPYDYAQQKRSGMILCEPNYSIRLTQRGQATSRGQALGPVIDPSHPADALFPEQWALRNSGQTGGTSGADIEAIRAWQIERGDPSVLIAIIDTGVDATHRDLKAQMWTNSGEIPDNGLDDDNNGYIDDIHGFDFQGQQSSALDDHGHGSHVAGTAAAHWNDRAGIVGVAPGARIMALKALDSAGSGSVAGAAEAVIYATNMGASITSNSYGSPSFSEVLRLAFEYAHSNGVVSVASAGNDASDEIQYPSGYRDVLSVAATDHNDMPADFTNFGRHVDLCAPGVSVLSSVPQFVDPSGYALFSGTSMSAPHVAGVAALIRAFDPDATSDAILSALRTATDPIPSDLELGTGRINALKALRRGSNPDLRAELSIERSAEDEVVPIMGTAGGADFDHYVLEIGLGAYPQTWTWLHTGHQPVEDGLLGNLDLETLPTGLSRVRVRVVNRAGRGVIDSAPTLIDNFKLTSILDQDILRRGDIYELRGSTGIANFQSYSIEWRPYEVDFNGTQHFLGPWSSAGVSLTSGGTQPIYRGLLGSFDTTVVNMAEQCFLRLRGHGIEATERTYDLYLDQKLKSGWPARVPHDLDYAGELGVLDPLIVDLDGNGAMEIYTLMTGRLHGHSVDGSTLSSSGGPGFPVQLPVAAGEIYTTSALTAADIDRDGHLEILFGGVRGNTVLIHAIERNGTFTPGYPLSFDYSGSQGAAVIRPYSSVVVADIDVDGVDEIVFQAFDLLVITEPDGSLRTSQLIHLRPGSSSDCERPTLATTIDSTPAVADIDGDAELEIITFHQTANCGSAGTQPSGQVTAFKSDGAIAPGWPRYTLYPPAGASPAIGDLDNQGGNEIVIAAGTSFGVGGVHVYNGAGQLLPGWPQLEYTSAFTCSPTLVDLDDDGKLEIALGDTIFDLIWIFHHNGAPFRNGYVQRVSSPYAVGATDVDQDGFVDLTATENRLPNSLLFGAGRGALAWDGFGNILPLFPMATESNAWAPIQVLDIDGDGLVEGVGSSFKDVGAGYWSNQDFKRRGSIYVWEFPWAVNPASQSQWPTFHGNLRRTGFYE